MLLSFSRNVITKRVTRALVQWSIAILALAFVAVASERTHINLATASLLYVIVIVLIARVGGLLSSVAASLIASLLLAYITPPRFSFRIDDPFDVVAIVAFLITSFIVAGLVSRLREMSQEALLSVSRKLVDAEERVRVQIGKELHDDIEQRLALLAIEVEQLSGSPSNPAEQSLTRMRAIRDQTSRIAADVQALAYQLRPYQLEYLGIAKAMRSFCERFGEHHRVEVDFKSHDLPPVISMGISLCLLRVLQQSLDNSARHSGVRRFAVELFGATGAIHLRVCDSGVGFNPQAAVDGPGLGLMSMRERVKLVNGEFSIVSKRNKGTAVCASVPLLNTNDEYVRSVERSETCSSVAGEARNVSLLR